MRTILALLALSVSVFAQVNPDDPETVFKKVDSELSSLITKVYVQGKLTQEFANEYSEGDREFFYFTLPEGTKHSFSHKYGDDGKAKKRSEYDPGGQLLKTWKYERAGDGSFTVTETGQKDSVIWRYDAANRLTSADYRSEDDAVYKKLVNSYDANGRLTASEERTVADGQETIFSKTDFVYDEKGQLASATTHRDDGTKNATRTYDAKGDLILIVMYTLHEKEQLKIVVECKYEDTGHGSEKVSETRTTYQGGVAKGVSKSEFKRVYKN